MHICLCVYVCCTRVCVYIYMYDVYCICQCIFNRSFNRRFGTQAQACAWSDPAAFMKRVLTTSAGVETYRSLSAGSMSPESSAESEHNALKLWIFAWLPGARAHAEAKPATKLAPT